MCESKQAELLYAVIKSIGAMKYASLLKLRAFIAEIEAQNKKLPPDVRKGKLN